MLLREKIIYMILLIILITFIFNVGPINDFLSFHNAEKTVEFDDSHYIVPVPWNTTDEMDKNASNENAMTNGYIVFDAWDGWPEDHITSVSEAKFREMENGSYEVLKNENVTMSKIPVSKQYYSNPTRNTDTVWDHVGVNYVFPKDDTNYLIQVHYFTTHDYNNESYKKEIDNRVDDIIDTMVNNNYKWYISMTNKILYNQTINWNSL